MSKSFMFVGDVHASSRNFSTRTDKSSETTLVKLEYLLEQADKTGSALVFTGDFLDNNQNSREYLLALIRLFKKYKCPKFSIIGNHECRGDDFSSAAYSQLQFLFESEALTYFDSNLRDIQTDYGNIRGYSAYTKLSTDNAESVIGIVCHHFLIDSFNDTLVVYPDKLKEIFPNLKFIVAGHDHAYYPITYSNSGVAIVRPGSLTRISSGKENNRKPCYAQVELTDEPLLQFVYKEVPAAKYSELFSLNVKDMKKEATSAVDSFILDMRRQIKIGVDLSSIFRARLAEVQDEASRKIIETDLQEYQFLS